LISATSAAQLGRLGRLGRLGLTLVAEVDQNPGLVSNPFPDFLKFHSRLDATAFHFYVSRIWRN
jgi:hypothetical protein